VTLPGPLVSVDWLAQHLDDVDLADVRWSVDEGAKLSDYRDGHLPKAVFVDLDADLSDPPGDRGRHPLPSTAQFQATLERLGLGRHPVVCYDDASGATAARMWWMLDAVGHPAAVLDGGLAAWTGALEQGDPPTARPVETDPSTHQDWDPGRIVAVDEVLGLIDGGTAALDARSSERFAGNPNPVDPVLGHIPGASSRPWTENVDSSGRLRPAEELRRQFESFGLDDSSVWIASCGSGVTACHNLLAARMAGLPDGRLYAGSWSEWIRDPSRPVATGDE